MDILLLCARQNKSRRTNAAKPDGLLSLFASFIVPFEGDIAIFLENDKHRKY